MNSRFSILSGIFSLLLFGSCEFAQPIEGGGGTEGEGLTGTLVLPTGEPAVAARVWLFPAEESAAIVLAKRASVTVSSLDSVQTNANGAFHFTNLAKGTYGLSASLTHGDTVLSFFRHGIVVNGTIHLGTDTLRVSGGITLRVQMTGGGPLAGAICSIEGSPWSATSNASGDCVFAGVPPGTVKVTVSHPAYATQEAPVVVVQPGQSASAGTVELESGSNPVDTLPVDTAGLLAYFPFSEGTGNTTASTGSVDLDPAVLTGAGWSAGVNGSGLLFNGSAHRAVVENASTLTGMSQLTVEAWVKLNQVVSTAYNIAGVWGPSSREDDCWALYLHESGHFYLAVSGSAGTTQDNTALSNVTVPVGTWAHLAGVYSGDSLFLYLNGSRVLAKASINRTLQSINRSLEIGAIPAGNGAFASSWPGEIDELKIYDVARSASQVRASYERSNPNGSGTSTDDTLHFGLAASTVALWSFNTYNDSNRIPDLGPHGFSLIRTSAVPLEASPNGSALVLNGTTHKLSAPFDSTLTLAPTGILTFESRIFVSAYPVGKPSSDITGMYGGLVMRVQPDGSFEATVQKGTSDLDYLWYDAISAPNTVPLNQWVDVAVAVDQTVFPHQFYGYIDGMAVQLHATASSVPIRIYEAPFMVGHNDRDERLAFAGKIDEIRISNTLVLGTGLPLIP